MNAVIHNVLTGALAGLLAAARTDYHAFRDWMKKAWKDTQEGKDVKFPKFDWKKAISRWAVGVVIGALMGLAPELFSFLNHDTMPVLQARG